MPRNGVLCFQRNVCYIRKLLKVLTQKVRIWYAVTCSNGQVKFVYKGHRFKVNNTSVCVCVLLVGGLPSIERQFCWNMSSDSTSNWLFTVFRRFSIASLSGPSSMCRFDWLIDAHRVVIIMYPFNRVYTSWGVTDRVLHYRAGQPWWDRFDASPTKYISELTPSPTKFC